MQSGQSGLETKSKILSLIEEDVVANEGLVASSTVSPFLLIDAGVYVC